jgi:hypothetical protein
LYGLDSGTELLNSVVAFNVAPSGSELALENRAFWFIRHTDIYSPGDHPLYFSAGSVFMGHGNIAADPLFVDPNAADYRLTIESPCVDAGANEDLDTDWADLDGDGNQQEPIPFDLAGNPRVCRFAVDMGAYEVPFGDLNGDQRIDFRDINPFVLLLSDQAAYQLQYPGCDLRYADLNTDGRVDFRDINPFVAALTGTY